MWNFEVDWIRNEGMHERRKIKDMYNCCEMQEWLKKSERNVKRQKDASYTDTGWVKSKSNKNKLLSDAQDYKYQDCWEMHEWIRECKKK